MKNRFALGVIVAALAVAAGCQKQSPAPAPATTPAGETQAAAASNKITHAEPFNQALPEGVSIDFGYHARSIKTVKSKKTGASSQQFLLEYLSMDAKAASDAVSADMTRAGFALAKSKKARGGYNLYFQKGEYGPVKVYVRKKSAKKLQHADAKGMVKLVFPLPGTAPATTASSPASAS